MLFQRAGQARRNAGAPSGPFIEREIHVRKKSTKAKRMLAASLLGLALVAALPQKDARAADEQTFIVLYKGNGLPEGAAGAIEAAGGTFVFGYPQIGVAIAKSTDPGFALNLRNDASVAGVSASARFAAQVKPAGGALATSADAGVDIPVDDSLEPFFTNQWDMTQIHVPEAHAITSGDPSVVVGDIDTGVDFVHPDLAANIDFSRSVSCIGGVPNQSPAAWDDDAGHGNHTAGIIAARANGLGIIGVAPNVKLAAIKAGDADEFLVPDAVICAFVWAADHGIAVTNNSYYVDPWLYNCKNDPEQRAIWEAERRAIRYALSKNVTVVSILHNQSDDLAHPQVDVLSPDFPPGSEEERTVTNACAVIPVEVPGVIGVSANGRLLDKAWYSNYGVGVTQLVAPGGDSVFQGGLTGEVLSTYPHRFVGFVANGNPLAKYQFLQGTSMAAPHVAGVAALMISRFGPMTPGQLQAHLYNTADPVECPPNPFLAQFGFALRPSGDPQECQGGKGNNSFYGHGQVNAFEAVR
jgi:lantibiotic leader peptide-processing serine protease